MASLSQSIESLSLDPSSDAALLVGISFGGQNTALCVETNGKRETIANEDGDRLTPVFVTCIGDGEHLVGTQAKIQSVNQFRSTLVNFRHLVGARGADATAALASPRSRAGVYPLRPAHGGDDDAEEPTFHVTLRTYDEEADEERVLETTRTASQLAEVYFGRLRQTAEGYLGSLRARSQASPGGEADGRPGRVGGCVVAVPADFAAGQRAALAAAVRAAGFDEVHLVGDAAAAVLAYVSRDAAEARAGTVGDADPATRTDIGPRQLFLVADLGAQALKASVVQFSVPHTVCGTAPSVAHHGLLTVLSSIVDESVGGQYMDKALATGLLVEEFRRKTRMDVSDSRKALVKLVLAAENLKKALSARDSAPCYVESLHDGVDLHTNVHRARFEMLVQPQLQAGAAAVAAALAEAGVTPGEIDQVLFVGGASRVPGFQRAVRSVFASAARPPLFRSEIEPDEAIAQGCAVHGCLLRASGSALTAAPEAQTALPHLSRALALDAGAGVPPVPLVAAQTPLPVRRKLACGVAPGQTHALVRIVELGGSSKMRPIFEVACPVEHAGSTLSVTLTVEASGAMKLHTAEPGAKERVWAVPSAW